MKIHKYLIIITIIVIIKTIITTIGNCRNSYFRTTSRGAINETLSVTKLLKALPLILLAL